MSVFGQATRREEEIGVVERKRCAAEVREQGLTQGAICAKRDAQVQPESIRERKECDAG